MHDTEQAGMGERKLKSREVLGLLKNAGFLRRMNVLGNAIKKVGARGQIGHFDPTGAGLLIEDGPQGYGYLIRHEDPVVQEMTRELVEKLLSGEEVNCRLVIYES